jgi:hypothetical protein
VGNGLIVWRFIESERGDFRAALSWVLVKDDSEVIHINAEDESGSLFRVRQYAKFYAPRLSDRRNVIVVNDDTAQWLFVHRIDNDPRPAPAAEERDEAGRRYRLVQSFPARGPWAWGWFVYRRAE